MQARQNVNVSSSLAASTRDESTIENMLAGIVIKAVYPRMFMGIRNREEKIFQIEVSLKGGRGVNLTTQLLQNYLSDVVENSEFSTFILQIHTHKGLKALSLAFLGITSCLFCANFGNGKLTERSLFEYAALLFALMVSMISWALLNSHVDDLSYRIPLSSFEIKTIKSAMIGFDRREFPTSVMDREKMIDLRARLGNQNQHNSYCLQLYKNTRSILFSALPRLPTAVTDMVFEYTDSYDWLRNLSTSIAHNRY